MDHNQQQQHQPETLASRHSSNTSADLRPSTPATSAPHAALAPLDLYVLSNHNDGGPLAASIRDHLVRSGTPCPAPIAFAETFLYAHQDRPALLLLLGDCSDATARHAAASIEESERLTIVAAMPEAEPLLHHFHRADVTTCAATNIEAIAAAVRIAKKAAAQATSLRDEATYLRKTQERADAWLAQVDQELHMAAAVQREMLGHRPPSIPGIETAAIFKPLWHVSGDIYSFEVREDGLTFVLADAMGHGLGAAMHSMIIAHELLCGGLGCAPARGLERLNREMCASQTERVRFATAVFGHICPKTRLARLAVAGHHPPLLLRDGRCIDTTPDGAILGVFPENEYIEASLTLLPGDTLVIFSDGVEQACMDACASRDSHKGDEYRHLLTESLSNGRTLDAGIERLMERLTTQRSSLHQNDDLTVLALRISE